MKNMSIGGFLAVTMLCLFATVSLNAYTVVGHGPYPTTSSHYIVDNDGSVYFCAQFNPYVPQWDDYSALGAAQWIEDMKDNGWDTWEC